MMLLLCLGAVPSEDKAVRFSFVKFCPCCVDTWNAVLPAVLLDLYPVTLASTINPWIKLDFVIDSNLFSDCVLMIFWRFRELSLDGWICHMWCCPVLTTVLYLIYHCRIIEIVFSYFSCTCV